MLKISREQVRRETSGSDFKREITIMKGDEQITLKQTEIKDYLMKLAEGKQSLNKIEKDLVKAGLEGMQWERRKEIMDILEEIVETQIVDKAA